MGPLAVTEDTGGSTRLPAACCQNFGFDPSRNHYPNDGNPGMSFTNDQLGLNARSISDIIFYDIAVMGTRSLHQAAAEKVSSRVTSSIKIGTPLIPFVDTVVPADFYDSMGERGRTIEQKLKKKYQVVKASLASAGSDVAAQDWKR